MAIKNAGLSVLLLTLLAGCGSDSAPQNESSSAKPAGQSTAPSTGEIRLPLQNDLLEGNLLVDISAADVDGVAQVALQFNQSDNLLVLCDSVQSCASPAGPYSASVNAIYPGQYGVSPGDLKLTLWVWDQTDASMSVDSVDVTWQPKVISNIAVTRSVDGTQIDVSWQANTGLLRYNLYAAHQSGVNRLNYQNLPGGQAALAIDGDQHSLTNLTPTQTYYLVLAGVDGSGESTYSQEFVVPVNVIINGAPDAQDDQEQIQEDVLAQFSPLQNDTDPDGDNLTIQSAFASSGQVNIGLDQIGFQPPANFNGILTIDYVVADPFGATDSAQITVTVEAVNDDPVANDDQATTGVDESVNIDVLANDTDVDTDPLTVTNAFAGQGTTTIEADDTITYQPDNGFVGVDTLEYEISDGNGGTAQASVSVTVSISPIAPEAGDDSYDMVQDTILVIKKSSGLLLNDTDANGDPLQVDIQPVDGVSSGTLTLSSDGEFSYTPNNGFFGVDSFVYRVVDSDNLSDLGQVTINVAQLPENLLGQSIDMTGQFLYIGQGETSPGSGIGTGLYRIGDCLQIVDTYCSMLGSYQESAGSGNAPGEIGRYAFVMSYSGTGDSPVLAQSNAPGSDSVVFSQLGDAKFELKLFPPNGKVITSVFPDADFSTLANFGAFITNPQTCQGLPQNVTCRIGTVGLTLDAVETAPMDRLEFSVSGYATVDVSSEPVAEDDGFVTPMNQMLSVAAPGVLLNDDDADTPTVGDILNVRHQIVTATSQPVSLAVDEYRQLLYIYDGNSAEVQVRDRSGNLNEPMEWQGEGANDADLDVTPVAMSLNNVSLPQGTLLMFNGETGPTEVYAMDPENYVVLAQLNTSFGASHVVGGAYNPISETLFLLQDNVPGVINGNLVAEVDPNTGAVLSSFSIANPNPFFNVSFGDLDVNNVTGNLYLVSSIDSRIAEFTRDGRLVRYLPLPAGPSNPSGIAINQGADRLWLVNNSANSPVFEVEFANQGTLPQLIATLVSGPANGAVTLNLDGSFSYAPNAGFTGQDSFVYRVEDQTGKEAQATVTITVQ